MYARDLKAMKSLECEKRVESTFVDETGQEHTWPRSPMLTLESPAENAGFVFIKRGVAPMQPQRGRAFVL